MFIAYKNLHVKYYFAIFLPQRSQRAQRARRVPREEGINTDIQDEINLKYKTDNG
jgi:hypothetical protein